MIKKIILRILMSVITSNVIAGNFNITSKEQQQITNEAEDWIDDIPDGLQDRLADAVTHAMQGMYAEINYFRNMADTTGMAKYNVSVKKINGGESENIPMRLYSSHQQSTVSKPLLIYFHGGGGAVGSLDVTEKFCRALVSLGNVNVISVEYPLTPEKSFPTAIETGVKAVEYIQSKITTLCPNTKNFNLGGDGFGGNLALEVLNRLKKPSVINSIVLYYPLLRVSDTLDPVNKRNYGRGYGFDSRLWEAFVAAYKGKDVTLPVSLPKTLIISAGRDIVVNDSEIVKSSAGDITIVEFSGALHGFLTDGHQKTAFSKAVALTDLFLSNH